MSLINFLHKLPIIKGFVEGDKLYNVVLKYAKLATAIEDVESIIEDAIEYEFEERVIEKLHKRKMRYEDYLNDVTGRLFNICRPLTQGMIAYFKLENGLPMMGLGADDIESHAFIYLFKSLKKYDPTYGDGEVKYELKERKIAKSKACYLFVVRTLAHSICQLRWREGRFNSTRPRDKYFSEFEQHQLDACIKGKNEFMTETDKRRRHVLEILAKKEYKLPAKYMRIIEYILKHGDITILKGEFLRDKFGYGRGIRGLMMKHLKKIFEKHPYM